ncbi:MAG: hypothetical protein HYS13_03475 [Planctomycetia bacterium]|nr:hypothetical protein [Planctomycetia bacterium]
MSLGQADGGRPAGALWVALIAGVIGAFMGTLPRLQSAVESAQVLAGIVEYPPDNPFYLYHIKSWTLLHQVPALLLQLGFSERVVSVLLGALFGMISFQALALTCYAVGRNAIVALALPILAIPSRLYEEVSNVYPIFLLTEKPWNCYGICGTGLALLAWSLCACGWRKFGVFLMGLAPAVHPTMGAWCLVLGLPAMLWQCRKDKPARRGVLLALTAGCLVTLVSYGVHVYHARNVPPIDPALRDQYVTAFIEGWDTHRQPVPLHETVVIYGAACLALCGLALWAHGWKLEPTSRYLLQTLLLSSAASLFLVFATHFQNLLPTIVVMAMPGRFINVVCLALPALVLGMLARNRSDVRHQIVLVMVAAYALLRGTRFDLGIEVPPVWHPVIFGALFVVSDLWRDTEVPSARSFLRFARFVAVAGMLFLAAWELRRHPITASVFLALTPMAVLPTPWLNRLDRGSLRLLAAAAMLAVCAIGGGVAMGWPATLALAGLHLAALAGTIPQGWPGAKLPAPRVRWAFTCTLAVASVATIAATSVDRAQTAVAKIIDWHTHSVYRQAHRGSGYLLTGSVLRAVQLKTGRPVLLEGAALNQLPYVPESGPRMNNILQRIYGEDILAPRPPGWQMERGGLMEESGKELWEQRSAEEWQALSAEFHFTEVLTFSDWKLNLSVIARSKYVMLYAIPARDGSPPPSAAQVADRRAEMNDNDDE